MTDSETAGKPTITRLRSAGIGVAATAAALAAVTLLGACAAPASHESFYALRDRDAAVVTASSAPTTGPTATAGDLRSLPGVVVSAVSVPELVDRPQIVTRDSANRVVVSEQNLWAEPVKSGIGRTLATRLSRALDAAGRPARVAAYPQASIADPALRIAIDVVRFDAAPNGEAVVDAVWSVRRPSDQRTWTGRTVASSPIDGTSYEAIVGAWNDAVATVDRDIASAVVRIGVDQPADPAR